MDAENLKIVAGLGHSQDLENQMLVMLFSVDPILAR